MKSERDVFDARRHGKCVRVAPSSRIYPTDAFFVPHNAHFYHVQPIREDFVAGRCVWRTSTTIDERAFIQETIATTNNTNRLCGCVAELPKKKNNNQSVRVPCAFQLIFPCKYTLAFGKSEPQLE